MFCKGCVYFKLCAHAQGHNTKKQSHAAVIYRASRLNRSYLFWRWSPTSPPYVVMQLCFIPCQMVLTSAQTPGASPTRLLSFYILSPLLLLYPHPSLLEMPSLEGCSAERAKQIWLSCLSQALECQLGKTCSYGCCMKRNESNYTDWQT